jgi:glycosyltransferase involved in cell wall biosynthesis
MEEVLEQPPTVVYVINSFDRGGAEAGLVTLVKGDLFKGCRLVVVGLVKGSGGIDAKLAALGHPPQIISDRASMRIADMPRIFARLRRLLLREQPDVVIASLPQANILSRLCLLFRPRTTFVSFEHNTHLAKRIYEVLYRLTSSRVNWLFADAAVTLDVAVRRLYRTPPGRRSVVPLLSFSEPGTRTRQRTHSGPFHIVNAARFTPVKNQSALIEALAILLRQQRNVKMTLFGEGPERQKCEGLADRLGVSAHVRFPGFVEKWFSMPADLFVLVSKHEGLCIVVLEAMHAGIPIAANVVGGMEDYADDTVLRRLQSLKPCDIANTISMIMDNSGCLTTQVELATAMIDRRFGSYAVRRIYEEINESLLMEINNPRNSERVNTIRASTSVTSASIEADL